MTVKQIFPVDYEAEVSHRLLEASHSADLPLAFHCISDPSVDVNFTGAVNLKTRTTELLLISESSSQVRVEFQEFVTDVTPLFLAVHAGNASLVRKLLVITNATLVSSTLLGSHSICASISTVLSIFSSNSMTVGVGASSDDA
jgi:hypothetical protein